MRSLDPLSGHTSMSGITMTVLNDISYAII